VSQTPGSIGYVELGYAVLNKLAYGQVQNKTGKFITPSTESASAAAAGAMKTMGANTDFRVSLTDPAGADAYPIATFTWLLVHKKYDDPTKGAALVKFIQWALTTGEAEAPKLGYAPLPKALLPWIDARLKTVAGAAKAAAKS
jgi:phosphate transport system substrate-binding protein